MYQIYLQIGDDTSTKLVLDGASVVSPVKGCKYYPTLSGHKETMDIELNGTAAAILAGVSSISSLVERAGGSPAEPAPLWLYMLPAVGDSWRSLVLAGECELLRYGINDRLRGNQGLRIVFDRLPCWEGAETNLNLTNGGGTGATAALYNHNDAGAGHDNYFDIAAADLLGDLPARCRILLVNANAGYTMGDVYLSNNVQQTALAAWMEGEDGDSELTTSQQNDATASGGKYRKIEWVVATEVQLIYWQLLSADLILMAGRPFIPIVRLNAATGYGNLWARVRLMYNPASAVFMAGSPSVLLDSVNTILPLPSLALPPVYMGALAHKAIYLAIYAKRDSAGTHRVDVDFLQLAALDSWRHLVPLYGTPEGYSMVDDGYTESCYIWHSTYGKLAAYAGYGNQVQLQPGRKNRISVLHHNGAISTPGLALTASVSYRPRKRIL